MKKLFAALSLVLCLCMLAGCAGTPVVYQTNCTCPTATTPATTEASTEATESAPTAVEGALKTGLALVANATDSTSATAEEDGQGKYDVTMVAVLVDDDGIIRQCIIDGIASSVKFDASGAITSDLTAAPQTKNELGDNYGMVAYAGAVAEWYQQAEALASYAEGKTAEELRSGAIDETGKAPAGSDLATSATIYLGGYVSAIEEAVANAAHMGAQSGDELRMAAVTGIDSSSPASADADGNAQLDVTVTALTMKSGVITSCTLDSVQAKVAFDAAGAITSDLTAAIPTKNQLGENYGMVAWGGAIADWNEQAASFASYITGKTADEVAGIAVNERTVPTDADLTTSVTIAIGGFQALVQKAAQ